MSELLRPPRTEWRQIGHSNLSPLCLWIECNFSGSSYDCWHDVLKPLPFARSKVATRSVRFAAFASSSVPREISKRANHAGTDAISLSLRIAQERLEIVG